MFIIALISSVLTYVFMPLEQKIIEKEKIITKQIIPKYILDEYKKYSIIGKNENSWKNFLDIYKPTNKTTSLPSYIHEDMKKAGFNATLLDENMWKNFIKYIINQSKLNDYKDNNVLFAQALSGEINLENIKKLIQSGYDINALNENGESYIQLIMQNLKSEDDIQNLKNLINEYGVNIYSLSNIDVFEDALVGKKDILNYVIDNPNANIREKLIQFLDEKGLRIKDNPEKYIDLMYLENSQNYKKQIIDNLDMQKKILKDIDAFNFVFVDLDNNQISNALNSGKYRIDVSSKGTNLAHLLSFHDNLSQENITKIIKSGINLNANSSFFGYDGTTGSTPLQTNIMFSANPNLKTIELLLQNGANPYIEDFQGKNAFDYAKTISGQTGKQIEQVLDKYKDKYKRFE